MSKRPARIGGQPVQQRFIRSVGSGGQNPRHKATGVELSLDISRANLPTDAKARLREMPGVKLTKDGRLVIVTRGSQSQRENLDTARTRLLELVLQALTPGVRRLRVRIPNESRELRLVDKHLTAARKQARHDHGEE